MEIVYQDLLNDVVTRFNLLKNLILEINEIKKLYISEETKYVFDHEYFNDTNVSRYSGLIQIKKDIMNALRISDMTKKVLDSVNLHGESPAFKMHKSTVDNLLLSTLKLEEKYNSKKASQREVSIHNSHFHDKSGFA